MRLALGRFGGLLRRAPGGWPIWGRGKVFPRGPTWPGKKLLQGLSLLQHMETRSCACCGLQKTIRGVWYLTPAAAAAPSPFVCETCFISAPMSSSASAPG